jgi:hypothetical protein
MFHECRFRWLLRLLPASFPKNTSASSFGYGGMRPPTPRARVRRRGVWADALKDTLRVAPRECWRDERAPLTRWSRYEPTDRD